MFISIWFTFTFFLFVLTLRYRGIKAFCFKKGKNASEKNNWMVQWAETKWKWTENDLLAYQHFI